MIIELHVVTHHTRVARVSVALVLDNQVGLLVAVRQLFEALELNHPRQFEQHSCWTFYTRGFVGWDSAESQENRWSPLLVDCPNITLAARLSNLDALGSLQEGRGGRVLAVGLPHESDDYGPATLHLSKLALAALRERPQHLENALPPPLHFAAEMLIATGHSSSHKSGPLFLALANLFLWPREDSALCLAIPGSPQIISTWAQWDALQARGGALLEAARMFTSAFQRMEQKLGPFNGWRPLLGTDCSWETFCNQVQEQKRLQSVSVDDLAALIAKPKSRRKRCKPLKRPPPPPKTTDAAEQEFADRLDQLRNLWKQKPQRQALPTEVRDRLIQLAREQHNKPIYCWLAQLCK